MFGGRLSECASSPYHRIILTAVIQLIHGGLVEEYTAILRVFWMGRTRCHLAPEVYPSISRMPCFWDLTVKFGSEVMLRGASSGARIGHTTQYGHSV